MYAAFVGKMSETMGRMFNALRMDIRLWGGGGWFYGAIDVLAFQARRMSPSLMNDFSSLPSRLADTEPDTVNSFIAFSRNWDTNQPGTQTMRTSDVGIHNLAISVLRMNTILPIPLTTLPQQTHFSGFEFTPRAAAGSSLNPWNGGTWSSRLCSTVVHPLNRSLSAVPSM